MRTLRHAEVDSVGTHRCGCSAVCACAVELYELALVGRVRGGCRLVKPLFDEHREAPGVDGELCRPDTCKRGRGMTRGNAHAR